MTSTPSGGRTRDNAGTKCGSAPLPTSPAQVHHFLKVTINGGSVTVTPTDSTGRTFDVRTYTFTPKPDTFLDTTPPVGSNSTSASFTFHASSTSATYTCKLDAGIAGGMHEPEGVHGSRERVAHVHGLRHRGRRC